jgi:hypothetical protein
MTIDMEVSILKSEVRRMKVDNEMLKERFNEFVRRLSVQLANPQLKMLLVPEP